MCDDELPQQKDETAFERRVLAAIEKPEQSRFIKIINSGLCLWLASVVFVTIGGAYFSSRLACKDDGNKALSKLEHLLTEIDQREYYISVAILDAKTIDDLKKKLKAIPNTYAEFERSSLRELKEERNKLVRSSTIGDTDEKREKLRSGEEDIRRKLDDKGIDPTLYDDVFLNERISDLAQKDLENLAMYAANVLPKHLESSRTIRFYDLVPRCSFWSIVSSWFSDAPQAMLTPGQNTDGPDPKDDPRVEGP